LIFNCEYGSCTTKSYLSNANIRKEDNDYYIVIDKGASDCIDKYSCNFPTGEYSARFKIKDDKQGLSNEIIKRFEVGFKDIQLVKKKFNVQTPGLVIKTVGMPTSCKISYRHFVNGQFTSEPVEHSFTTGTIPGSDGRYTSTYQPSTSYKFGEGDNDVTITCMIGGSAKTLTDTISIDTNAPTVTLRVSADEEDYTKQGDVFVLTATDKTMIIAHVNEETKCKYSKVSSNINTAFSNGYTDSYDYNTPEITFGNTAEKYYVKCIDDFGNPSNVYEIEVKYDENAPEEHDPPIISNAQIFNHSLEQKLQIMLNTELILSLALMLFLTMQR